MTAPPESASQALVLLANSSWPGSGRKVTCQVRPPHGHLEGHPVFHVDRRLAGEGRGVGGIQELPVRFGGRITDRHFDHQLGRGAGHGAPDQIAEPEHGDDEPAQRLVALGGRIAGQVAAVDGAEHQHPELPSRLLDQGDPPGDRRQAAVAGLIQGLFAHRIGGQVEAQRLDVVGQRLDEIHRIVFGPLAGRHHLAGPVAFREPEPPDA